MTKEQIGLGLGFILFLLISFVIPFDMEPKGKYALAITAIMAIWWVTEALPLPITALLPLVLFPLFGVMTLEEAGSGYSSPIIYLFLGGFMLAIAIERWNLHKRIALAIITRIGDSLSLLVWGFVIATGLLSMWISNTATALMMLPIGLAVMSQLNQVEDPELRGQSTAFGKALLLGIAYASSIGGIATLVGTPTNMVFTSYAEKNYPDMPVNFADWLWFATPPVLVLLVLLWWYLVRVGFPLSAKLTSEVKASLKAENEKLGAWTYEEKTVLVVFGLVAFCWITRGFFLDFLKSSYGISFKGLSDTTIALVGATSLFLIPSRQRPEEKILTWEAASKLPWDVILLFGGGLSLADGFDASGLATWIANKLSLLNGIPFLALLFAISILVLVLTEFASNVATVSMMLPVLASLSTTLGVHPYILMISATCVASAGFMMPMGTAANALVFGTGHLKINDMIRAGFWLDLLSILIFTLYAYWATPYFFVK